MAVRKFVEKRKSIKKKTTIGQSPRSKFGSKGKNAKKKRTRGQGKRR